MIRYVGALLLAASACCCAQQPNSLLPPNYKVVLDEPFAKVIRVHYAPHEKVAAHDHPPTPTVYVYLNDAGPVRFTHEEGGVFTAIRPPTHKGAFRVNEGRAERHSVENLGDVESDFLRVELLGIGLGDKSLDARGQAPADFSSSREGTEFSSNQLAIVRAICTGPKPCDVDSAPTPSVIVALSDLNLIRGTGQQSKQIAIKSGEVIALHPNEHLSISPMPGGFAHILKLDIPEANTARTPMPAN